MTIDREDLINSIMASLGRMQHIKLEDIPNIDLYMDQVTTFMDRKLKNTTRYPDEDKILTKVKTYFGRYNFLAFKLYQEINILF